MFLSRDTIGVRFNDWYKERYTNTHTKRERERERERWIKLGYREDQV